MSEPIITEDNPQPFIVRVKLLSNQVHEFTVDKNMKVADFKLLISPKVHVPIDRMRIVFAGRQLVDDKPLAEYVSQSGMTVHLIARTAPPEPPVQNPQPSTTNQNSQGPSRNPQVPPNPFGDIMGMVGSLFGGPQTGGNAPQITMSFGSSNNPLGGLLGSLGSLGVRIPTPPQPEQQGTLNARPTQQSQPSQSQSQNSNGNNNQRISYQEIGQLNQSLNNLNVPLDSVTSQNESLTPEGVIRYLRRLHHQSSRSMLQLNRLLNLAQSNNNNTSMLAGFIPVFQSLNSANNVAISCLTDINQRNTTSSQPSSNQTQPTLRVGVVIPENANLQQSQTQPRPQPQPQQQQPQPQPQPQQSQQQAQFQMPIPIPMMNMPQNMNPLQMMQGLDIGSLMGGLSSVGGIGGLFSMSLRDMMSENQNEPPGIFLDIFGSMTGQNMMQMFTTKDFRFLNDKHTEIRENLKKRIEEKGEEPVINEITNEAANVLVPANPHPMINDLPSCRSKCLQKLKKHVRKLVEVSLGGSDPDYYLKATSIAKTAFCENIQIITSHTSNSSESIAFEIIKRQTMSILEPVLPGISGLFYSLVERDLFRIYQQFKAEEERRNQMSADEAQSQQKLIQMIKEVGAKDSEKLANTKHSKSYYQ